jgi:cytidylate kinase
MKRLRGMHGLESADGVGVSKYQKQATKRGAPTIWRPHQEGQVRTRKEFDRARHTHELETASGGTSQDTERIRPSEVHSRTGDRIGRDKSGHGENLTKRGALADWKPHREGQVRTRKESDRARRTHGLETALGGTSQDTERIRPSEAHSQTGDHIRRDKSGHRKNPTERGALTG